MKADRLPRWKFALLKPEQREAYDRLRWHRVEPAERARLKIVLGWKRTRDETLALADELLDQDLLERVVADRIGVTHRYLRRMLVQRGETPEIAPLNPNGHAAKVAPTCETGTTPQPPRTGGRNPVRFNSFRDLNEWLDGGAA